MRLQPVMPTAQPGEVAELRRSALPKRDDVIDLEVLSFVAIGNHAGLIPCFQGSSYPRGDRPAEMCDRSHVGAFGQDGFDHAV